MCIRDRSGAIFLSDGKGGFKVEGNGQPFADHVDSEDMGVLFFDADSDGDPDLYVSSGSYEYKKGDPKVRDRLYVNDGSGQFASAPEGSLPKFTDNSSVVCGADFDRDGDLDLFVGGRVLSGEYPLAATSRILINESVPGQSIRFVASSNDQVSALANAGMVTSALWTEVNGDGWVDLMVTTEWGPVRVFLNDSGKLVEATKESGLANILGWWNSITGADIDNDGDIDYAIGNSGQNTKYYASVKKPIRIYYGDYEGDGSKSIVEAKYENGVLLPIRGKSCSTSAIPSLGEKFKTFHQFASSSLSDIYTPARLKGSAVFEANELSSGILVNNGKGSFTFKALPSAAQNAPIFGLNFCDVNGDGNLDLYAAQNFSVTQFETPPYRGGLSQLMLGDGEGGFKALTASESGLIVPTDGRGLARTDINGDGLPDFVVAVNDGELQAFTRVVDGPRPKKVILKGAKGNPMAAGSKILFKSKNVKGRIRVEEIYQGGGYLSQSGNAIYIDSSFDSLIISWPDGKKTEHSLSAEKYEFTFTQPD